MSEWQPIETAPKDRSLIVLAVEGLGPYGSTAFLVAWWAEGEWNVQRHDGEIITLRDIGSYRPIRWTPLPEWEPYGTKDEVTG